MPAAKRLSLIAATVILAFSTNVRADEDDSYVAYDALVEDLRSSGSDETPSPIRHEEVNWDEVAIHGGLGIAASIINFNAPDGTAGSGLLKGFEAHIGFNLFNKIARAEAAFRNFGQDTVAAQTVADLREFELRMIFLPVLQDKTWLRMGGGLSQRSMNIHSKAGSIHENTPFYSLLLGFERKVAPNISLGPDLSHHAALESSTYDRSSWDASLRLNATF